MGSCDISDQLERVLNSQALANKRQLRKLLEVLFKNMNSPVTLTPDLVIKELWPLETRTKRAADVATEMNRLRHALKDYYDGQGTNDPVVFILPNRSVVAGDGAHERPWIVAKPRIETENGAAGNHLSDSQVNATQEVFQKRLNRIALFAGLAALLGIAAYISVRILAMPDQPRLGRLEGSALVITNAEGKELWRKPFPQGFGPDTYYAQWAPTRIWFGDLEGKGHTSVLFSYSPAGPVSHSSTLICYSDRGKEKWRWTPGKRMQKARSRLSSKQT